MRAHLPVSVKLAYGVGAAGWVLIDRIVVTWLYFHYVTNGRQAAQDAAAVDPAVATAALMAPLAFGVVMFAGRAVDAVADPVVARLSDNHAGGLGRRTPFLLGATVPYIAVYVALFHPPVAGPSGWNVAYLAVLLGLYFVLFTAYVGPYLALLADLSRSPRDRVDLSTSKAAFTLVGSAVALVGSGVLVERLGIHWMVWIMGAIGLVLMLQPWWARERRHATAEPASLPLVRAVRTTLANRPFLIALLAINALWFAFNIVTINVPLYVTSLLGMDEGAVSLLMAVVLGVALVAFPAVNLLTKRLGLKRMMIASLVGFALTLPLIAGLGVVPGDDGGLPFALGVMAVVGLPLAIFFVVPDALTANVADLEERRSGQRREGMYFGVQGLTTKLNLGISTLVSGAMLEVFGDPTGIRLTGPVAGVVMLLGALVLLRYPERQVEAERARLPGGEPIVDPGEADD